MSRISCGPARDSLDQSGCHLRSLDAHALLKGGFLFDKAHDFFCLVSHWGYSLNSDSLRDAMLAKEWAGARALTSWVWQTDNRLALRISGSSISFGALRN